MKPSPVDLKSLDVRHIEREDAKAIILPNHYSGTWNTTFGLINFGIFDGDKLCGAAAFGHLMNPASADAIADLPPGAIVELNRLWIDDKLGMNTETAMLSRCFKWLKANTRVQLIQSFADGRLGVGTIYKAANFGYYGSERTRFFVHRETGDTFHQALSNNTAKLRTMLNLTEWWIDGKLGTFEAHTYRYLYPLTRYARRAIKLTPEPYPRYQRGVIESPYEYPLSVVARCYAVAEARGDPRAEKFITYLASESSPERFDQLLDEAEENAWVAQVIAEARTQPSLFDEVLS